MSAQSNPSSHERLVLWLLAAIQFTNVLDYVIIMPLGPQFMRVFNITPAQFGTLVSAYAISAGIAGLLAALYLDRFDRKQALLFLYAGFGLGTLVCAMAPDFHTLLIGRLVAGAFGGVTGAVTFAIVGDVVPEERRGAAMGLVMSSFSVSSVLGVPCGLYLANHFGWHATFYLLVVATAVILVIAWRAFPSLREHMERGAAGNHWAELREVLVHPNHIRAFTLMALLCLAGFSVIPFISPYLVKNVGLKETDLPLIYVFGGGFTVFTMNWVGRLADRFGKLRLFTIMASLAAMVTLGLTHLPRVPVVAVIAVTTVFMICMSGRFVPAMALITASVEPRLRGGFMSVNSSVQHFFAGVAAFLAGLLIHEGATAELTGYGVVGWLATGLMLLCIPLAARLRPAEPKEKSLPVETAIEVV